MSKKQESSSPKGSTPTSTAKSAFLTDKLQPLLNAVALRFNRQYLGQAFELPPEVEAMQVFHDWAAGSLEAKIASRFWEIAQPKKNQRCLDLGCGVSFLVYPWRDWDAFFYGQDISTVAVEALNTRGPQMNSKLFKGVKLGGAHELNYDGGQFDLVFATGWSCYYPLEYWQGVMAQVKRVLKPGGSFVFDVLDMQAPLAENWSILETYLGAEVFLEELDVWEKLLKDSQAKIEKKQAGELFQLYKVKF